MAAWEDTRTHGRDRGANGLCPETLQWAAETAGRDRHFLAAEERRPEPTPTPAAARQGQQSRDGSSWRTSRIPGLAAGALRFRSPAKVRPCPRVYACVERRCDDPRPPPLVRHPRDALRLRARGSHRKRRRRVGAVVIPTSGSDYQRILFASDITPEDKDDLDHISIHHLRLYIREYRKRSEVWDLERKAFVAHIARLEQELQQYRQP